VTQYGEGCHAEASSRATPFPFTRPLPSLHQATPFPSPGHSLAFTRPLPSLPQATLFPSPCHSPGHSLPHWPVVRSLGTGTETPGTLDPLCARGALSLFFQIVLVVILDDLTTAVSLPTKTDCGERRRSAQLHIHIHIHIHLHICRPMLVSQ
jgi:hypothetical protein